MHYRLSIMKHLIFSFLLLLLVSLSGQVFAKNVVTGKYGSLSGKSATFSIKVGNPAPASLIVQHYHSQSIKLTSASPKPKKIDNSNGVSKWFFKNVKPGNLSFSLTFSKPVPRNSVKAVLRYKDAATGKFIDSVIRP